MNLAIESNLPSPPELGEVDGSENNRLSVNSLNIFSVAFDAGMVMNKLPTNTINISVVLFLFIFLISHRLTQTHTNKLKNGARFKVIPRLVR
jgi:hypothetical protein